MNIVEMIIIVMIAFALLAGMHKGTIGAFLTAIGLGGAWIGACKLYTTVSNFALGNKTLMAILNQYLEPETFFTDQTYANMKLTDLFAEAGPAIEQKINEVIASVVEKFPLIKDALVYNIRNENFKALGLETVSDYFNQTLWVAVFNVLAFVLVFLLLFWAISIIVNLLNNVIRFPMLRVCDGLVGGIFGLICGYIIVLLVINITPAVTSLIDPKLTTQLESGSIYSFMKGADFFVGNWIKTLIQG